MTRNQAGKEKPLLEARGLETHFQVKAGLFSRSGGVLRAVDGVSLTLARRETLGLVGESGCGKTTLGRTLLHLLRPTGGTLFFEGRKSTNLSGEALRAFRRRAQMIFQDPLASLNPRMKAGPIIEEGLIVHRLGSRAERKNRVMELLERVGLAPEAAGKYPHEFSGGQRQRIGIARALAMTPALIVADEPVSALDVSIQAQIINLLLDLQASLGLSYLFISHDLRVVEQVSDRVAVMYLGKIVETAAREALYGNPSHPYTRALLEAIPSVDPETRKTRLSVEGDVPSPLAPPAGCHFHPRCPRCMEVCRSVYPAPRPIGPGHTAACHLYDGPGEEPARAPD